MRTMKTITALVLVLLLASAAHAVDRKARGRSAWAWASACQSCSAAECCTSQQAATKPETHSPKESPKSVETVTPQSVMYSGGSCASGQCGVSSGGGLFRSRRR